MITDPTAPSRYARTGQLPIITSPVEADKPRSFSKLPDGVLREVSTRSERRLGKL